MCYFNGVPKVSDQVIPRKRAIKAWKGFVKDGGQAFVSPHRTENRWKRGVPKKATKHGFYVQVRRPRVDDKAAGYGDVVKRVLIWGRVREYRREGWVSARHGYRAEFCMIPKRNKRLS